MILGMVVYVARWALIRIHAVGLGGTANLAVIGGNLPPNWTHELDVRSARLKRQAVGLPARQPGQWPVPPG